MKLLIFFLLMGIASPSAFGGNAEIVTTDGKVYREATVKKVEPDGLSIIHSNGVAKIPFEKLPADLQSKYGFDPAAATEHRAKLEDAQKRAAEAERAATMRKKTAAREDAAKTDEKEFTAQVARAAKMMKVVAHQNSKVGLIGDISEGTLTTEAVKNRLGNTVGKRPKWIFKAAPTDGVISGTQGAEAVTTRDDTGNPDGLPSTYATTIEWQGKAWRIGLIQYQTMQGLIRTCPLYTASETEAAGFYRRNGFSPQSDQIAKKAY